MMYATLYQYLIQHKQLSVPGIGNFLLKRTPAVADFPGKKIDPPAYSFTLHFPASPSSNGFFYWLSKVLGISDREAVIRFNDFSFDMRKQVLGGSTIEWKGVGTLAKGLAGEIRFTPAVKDWVFEQPVTAEKVIRENPEHMVRVGEDEKTSAEMVEMLNQQEPGRSFWWAIPLAIGLLAVVFAGWHFSRKGVSLSAAGNSGKLVPETPGATYKMLP